MTITLTPNFQAIVDQKIASGEFADESAVVEEALLLLEQRDQLQRLRESLALADEQIERGEWVEFTPELLERLSEEAHQNMLQGRPISLDVQP